jgi:predicted metal-dependent hydrolase
VRYVLRRAKRRTIGFTVGPQGLRVSAPRWTGLPEIEVALRVKASWILDKLADQDQRRVRRDASKIEWKTGAVLPFLGEPLMLVVHDDVACTASAASRGAARVARIKVWLEPPATQSEGPSETVADGDRLAAGHGHPRLHVDMPPGASPEAVRDAVLAWLKQQALAVFLPRCVHFAERLDVRYAAVRLSSAQTRWGSASSAGVIRLSWRLVHFPIATIDYVVAHELAHLREMNHSTRFWAIVEAVLPGYEAARTELKTRALPVVE